jgi:inner membrane protein
MQDSVERLASSIRNSQMLRLFLIGILALLLQIPIAMIGRLVSERQERRQAAVAEVSSKWGSIVLTGPALVLIPIGGPKPLQENHRSLAADFATRSSA